MLVSPSRCCCFFLLFIGPLSFLFFFFNDTATTEIYTLSLHDALPIWRRVSNRIRQIDGGRALLNGGSHRSEEHTSELQSQSNLVCRLLLEKKKINRLFLSFWWDLPSCEAIVCTFGTILILISFFCLAR